ncbi:MAG: DnaJ domain-containing protein [Candidatus Krumholzibacteria bacterium]|nr:DnaJ domain-containing protein [Candidatus Krumholzibacteria bacterium]
MKVDYYSILEVWPSSSNEEIKNSYFRLAKVYHPDVAGDTQDKREHFKLINEAFKVLSNPQSRHEYDESLRKSKIGSRSASAIQENDRRSASIAFNQAKESMRNGRFDKAAILLKSATNYDPDNPAYHSWYGFCLARLNTRLHEARDECKKAIQMEFYNADYHANLGFVYFKAGLKSLAIIHFKNALEWNPGNTVASKYMAIVEGGKSARGPIDMVFSALKGIFT